MTEDEVLKLWRKSIKVGDRVRHKADWKVGKVVGVKTHPMYDFEVDFGCKVFGNSQSYVKNLYPEWWPVPAWAMA